MVIEEWILFTGSEDKTIRLWVRLNEVLTLLEEPQIQDSAAEDLRA